MMRRLWSRVRNPHAETLRELLSVWRIAIFIVLFGVTYRFGHLQIFTLIGEHSEEVFLDKSPKKEAKFCHLVTVDSDEYSQNLANACTSPDELKKMVARILRYRPSVLVVDFDTSAKGFKDLYKKVDKFSAPVIWARDAEEEQGSQRLMAGRLLGSMTPGREFGYALFPRSSDWTVRTYEREIVVAGSRQPTLFWKTVEVFCQERPRQCPDKAPHETSIADLRYHFPETPLKDLLLLNDPAPPTNNSLAGKIVILGGKYSTQDRHRTGGGETNGVEILAAGIENELGPPAKRELSHALLIVADILIGFLIVAIHNWLRPIYALFATMIVLAGGLFFGTFALLHFADRGANFAPFLVAIWIEQLVEGAMEAEKKLEA